MKNGYRIFFKNEKGSISVFIAISFVVILGLSALVFDFGCAYINANELQNSADSAALACAQELPLDEDSLWNSEIVPVAQGYMDENDSQSFTINPVRNDNNLIVGVEVIASRELSVPLIDIFGSGNLSVQRRAVARVFTLNEANGLVPIGINQDVLDAEGFDGSIALDIDPSDEASVKYGWLFFDKIYDGNNNANSKLNNWMDEGYQDTVSVGDELPWTDGTRASTVIAYNDLIGKEVLAPIYEVIRFNDGGKKEDTGIVRITGFVMIKIEPYTPDGSKNKTMRATFIRHANISNTSAGGDDMADYRVGGIRLIS
ncbi:MAG: pilus assembly protein TadG-related protein [Proteocatella sp.]